LRADCGQDQAQKKSQPFEDGQPRIGLPQLQPLRRGQGAEFLDRRQHQFGVRRMRYVLWLHRGIEALIIAASILFIERWQISAVGYAYPAGTQNSADTQVVYRLDRWTGQIEYCETGGLQEIGSAAGYSRG
jgi:hypothetical protein